MSFQSHIKVSRTTKYFHKLWIFLSKYNFHLFNILFLRMFSNGINFFSVFFQPTQDSCNYVVGFTCDLLRKINFAFVHIAPITKQNQKKT